MEEDKRLNQIIEEALDLIAFDAAKAMEKQNVDDPNVFLFLVHQVAMQFATKFLMKVQERSFVFARKITQLDKE